MCSPTACDGRNFPAQKGFPEPEISEQVSRGRVRVIYENDDLSIETALVNHTVPCLAFAMVEKSGVHPDAARLSSGPLRPGPWVARVLDLLRNGTSPETPVEIDGGRFAALGTLADRYFSTTRDLDWCISPTLPGARRPARA